MLCWFPMLSFELYSSIILRSMIWVNFCIWYEDGRTSVFCLWLSSCASTMGWKTILSTTEFSCTLWTDSKYKSILSLSCLNYNICYLSGIGRRKQQPTPIFLPGKSHGRRAWQATVHRVTELDMTVCVCVCVSAHTHTHSLVVCPKDNFQRQWLVVFNLIFSGYYFTGEQSQSSLYGHSTGKIFSLCDIFILCALLLFYQERCPKCASKSRILLVI